MAGKNAWRTMLNTGLPVVSEVQSDDHPVHNKLKNTFNREHKHTYTVAYVIYISSKFIAIH